MAVQSFVLLVIFLSKCLGHTEFIYTTENEVKLFCDTNKWQISTESNSKVDVSCTVKCVPDEPLKLNNIQKFCTNKDSDIVEEKCSLIATSGYFRCVTALDSVFLHPFAPSPNTVTSYIVATANESITNKSVERSSVVLTEGEDVLLNCSFIYAAGYDKMDFSVYWIKTIEKKSMCVYSYEFEIAHGIQYNQHCNVQEDLLHRLSNQTDGKTTHNIRISNITGSDAGQYLCALKVQPHKGKRIWKIINNVTVSVHKGSEDKESQINGNILDTESIALYATIPILLALAIATVGFICKKTKSSAGSQAIKLQRNQQGDEMEETADVECSPYAVGSGEEVIKFKCTQDAVKQEETTDTYSVMKLNDLYGPGLE